MLFYDLEIDNLMEISRKSALLVDRPEILLQVVFQLESDFGTV